MDLPKHRTPPHLFRVNGLCARWVLEVFCLQSLGNLHWLGTQLSPWKQETSYRSGFQNSNQPDLGRLRGESPLCKIFGQDYGVEAQELEYEVYT